MAERRSRDGSTGVPAKRHETYKLKVIAHLVNTPFGFDLSEFVHNLAVRFSLVSIIPTVTMNFVIPDYLLGEFTQKPWTATITIYAVRGKGKEEVQEIIHQFEVVALIDTATLTIPGHPTKQKARHTYAQVKIQLAEKKTFTLLNNYVYLLWDWEDHKGKIRVPKVICEIFKQANTDGLKLVLHQPDHMKQYDQIAVPYMPFKDAFFHLYQHYGIYRTMPIIYSDGQKFYITSIEARAKKQFKMSKCCPCAKDDLERHHCKEAGDYLDKAVFIHTSTKDSHQKKLKQTIDKGVYRIDKPIVSGNRIGFSRYRISNEIKSVLLAEDDISKSNKTHLKDLIKLEHFPEIAAGKKNLMKHANYLSEFSELTTYISREHNYDTFMNEFIQRMIFNNNILTIDITSPLLLKHFMVGFTYKFISTSEQFSNLNGKYLANVVDIKLTRGPTASWKADVRMILTTASIKDITMWGTISGWFGNG